MFRMLNEISRERRCGREGKVLEKEWLEMEERNERILGRGKVENGKENYMKKDG